MFTMNQNPNHRRDKGGAIHRAARALDDLMKVVGVTNRELAEVLTSKDGTQGVSTERVSEFRNGNKGAMPHVSSMRAVVKRSGMEASRSWVEENVVARLYETSSTATESARLSWDGNTLTIAVPLNSLLFDYMNPSQMCKAFDDLTDWEDDGKALITTIEFD